MARPRLNVIFQSQSLIITMMQATISSKTISDKNSPSLCTMTKQSQPDARATMLKTNHGTGSPKATSKMLEPIEEDTAISPSPCLATITEDSKSGTEVPAARIVNPMTTSGIPKLRPKISASSTMQMARRPIITTDIMNVNLARCSFPGG